VPNHSKALVLHPMLSTYAQEHPDFDPFILPSDNEFLKKYGLVLDLPIT
jgi:hypothetical protein